MTERTWEISDLDGSNKRTVTLAQFLAYNTERAAIAQRIYAEAVASLRRRV